MRHHLSEVKAWATKTGVKGDWISSYLLWRPFSPYLSWVLVNLGVTSVGVASFNILLISVSVFFLFDNSAIALVIAAIGIELYNLLDHVDGELARYEMYGRGISNSRIGHFLDLFAHKISVIAMFALGWAVTQATDQPGYIMLSFMLCFFMFGPANEPANEIVIETAKKTDMTSAFEKIRGLGINQSDSTPHSAVMNILLFFNELFGFPGWLHLIVLACLMDASVEPVNFMNQSFLYREILLLGLTPIYVGKFVFSFAWYSRIMLSIRHE